MVFRVPLSYSTSTTLFNRSFYFSSRSCLRKISHRSILVDLSGRCSKDTWHLRLLDSTPNPQAWFHRPRHLTSCRWSMALPLDGFFSPPQPPRKDKKIIIIKNKLPSPLLSFSIPERTENVSLDVTQYTYREMRLRCNHAHHTIERTRSIPSFFFVEQKSNQQKMKKEEECP